MNISPLRVWDFPISGKKDDKKPDGITPSGFSGFVRSNERPCLHKRAGHFLSDKWRLPIDKNIYACIIVYNNTKIQTGKRGDTYAGNIQQNKSIGAEVL